MKNVPSVYVGTYAKYNDGSIDGAWLNLLDYEDVKAFYEACKELHSDEVDPEFMFQDYEYIPEDLISEGSLEDTIFEYFAVIADFDDEKTEAFEIFRANNSSEKSIETQLEQFNDTYQGHYGSNAQRDFAEEWAENSYLFENCNENLKRYFDYEAYVRDLFMDGFYEIDGHVFLDL